MMDGIQLSEAGKAVIYLDRVLGFRIRIINKSIREINGIILLQQF